MMVKKCLYTIRVYVGWKKLGYLSAILKQIGRHAGPEFQNNVLIPLNGRKLNRVELIYRYEKIFSLGNVLFLAQIVSINCLYLRTVIEKIILPVVLEHLVFIKLFIKLAHSSV